MPRPTKATFALELRRQVDDDLHAVDARGERRDDDHAGRAREDLLERVDDVDLRSGEALAIDVGAVAEQRQHALAAELGEAMEVEELSVERRLVDLEVAGVDEDAERRVDGEPDAVRHAVRDAQELDLEGTDLDDVLRPHGPESVVGEIVFVELGADERQRQRRAEDRTIDVRQQVGDGPDVVFVPVREHERGDATLLQVGEVGNDEVDAEELDVGEGHPGVDDETRVPVRNRHEVHAEFAEAAQRDDFKSRVAGERVAVPGVGARHRIVSHGAAGGFRPNAGRVCPSSALACARRRNTNERRPRPRMGLVRSSRGHDHRPGRRHRVRSGRWDGPKEAGKPRKL
jgi:hypothetical protein